jgi:hypothetical protein
MPGVGFMLTFLSPLIENMGKDVKHIEPSVHDTHRQRNAKMNLNILTECIYVFLTFVTIGGLYFDIQH